MGGSEQWGNMLMWEDLELTGSFEFLVGSIIDGSLVCVADSSYINELYQIFILYHLFWNAQGDVVG
jgi:hypothetical protein